MAKRQFVRVIFRRRFGVGAPVKGGDIFRSGLPHFYPGLHFSHHTAALLYLVCRSAKRPCRRWASTGLKFLTTQTWDANKAEFGILPQIWGTLYSSFLALLIGGVFGVTVALFLTQDFLPAMAASHF